MHLVVAEAVDWPALEAKMDQFQAQISSEPLDFRGVCLVRVSDAKAIFPVFLTVNRP